MESSIPISPEVHSPSLLITASLCTANVAPIVYVNKSSVMDSNIDNVTNFDLQMYDNFRVVLTIALSPSTQISPTQSNNIWTVLWQGIKSSASTVTSSSFRGKAEVIENKLILLSVVL